MLDSAGLDPLGTRPAPPSRTATPKPATPASRTRRRAERMRDFGAGTLAVILVTPSFCAAGARGASRCGTRWRALHYRALEGKLKFGKVGALRKYVIFQCVTSCLRQLTGPGGAKSRQAGPLRPA